MPAPPALTLTVEADHVRLPPGPANPWLLVTLTAGDAPAEGRRQSLVTVLALDVSASMAGPPLEQVVRSVDRILDLLAPDDRLGVVAFSTSATVVAPALAIDPAHKRAVRSRIARLRADERTNVEDGLRVARSLLPQPTVGERHAIVLLSDGEPNVGLCIADELGQLARSIRPAAVVSTLGYGTRHDDRVLGALAEGGGGTYRFIPDPTTCQLELAQAVGAQGDIAVEGVEITVAPAPGIQVLRVVGAPSPRFGSDGLVITLPDIPAGATRTFAIVLDASLDAARMSGVLGTLAVRYRRAGRSEILALEQSATVDIAAGDPVRSPSATARALVLRADEVRAHARSLADRGQFAGAAATIRELMQEITAAPGYVGADGSQLSEAYEQLLDEAMAYERRPNAEAYRTFKMSTSPRTFSADGLVASSRALGQTSIRYVTASAGLFPEAYLVVIGGSLAGQRHRLAPQNTIGRTSSADIPVPSHQVSRRHADVFALEGEFWIADLGSTNPTLVNGKKLGEKPHQLRAGDRVQVGDVVFSYEQPA